MNSHHQPFPRLVMARRDFNMSYDFAYMEIDQLIRKKMVAEPLTLKEIPAGHMIEQPTFSLNEDDVQALMDNMWTSGIRPSKRIIEPQNIDHMNNEISWLRETADHLMKKTK